MKTCPTCGLDADDRFLYCPDDGSALGNLRKGDGALMPDESMSNPAKRVKVLFCPACEGEYPLTFSACPIDGLRLTRERRELKKATAAQVEVAAALAPPASPIPVNPEPVRSSTSRVEEIEPDLDLTAHYDSKDEGLSEAENEIDDLSTALPPATGLIERIRSDRPSFRIAAIATMIGLALFGLSAAYRLYTYGLRKPSLSTPVETTRNQQEDQPSFFIETPKEARDYVEENASNPTPGSGDQSPVDNETLQRQDKIQPAQPPRHLAEKERSARQQDSIDGQPARPAQPAGRLTEVSAPVAPHSTGGSVQPRLVRVRANRTQPGYRYDLTFTLQELTGRPVRWNSLTVSARSASGVNHLQTIPFHHRLGASGTMTFTVSVDMAGKSGPDWRGRIVCTTVGADNSGRVLKATFGANVSP